MTTQNQYPQIQTVQVATKITTKNDVNGNGRRLWVINEIVHDGIRAPHSNRVGIIEEGYEGTKAIKTTEFYVAPSEYNVYLKAKKEMDKIKKLKDEELLKELHQEAHMKEGY